MINQLSGALRRRKLDELAGSKKGRKKGGGGGGAVAQTPAPAPALPTPGQATVLSDGPTGWAKIPKVRSVSSLSVLFPSHKP